MPPLDPTPLILPSDLPVSEVFDRETLVETPRFRLERRRERQPDGVLQERDVIVHPGAVVILPIAADGRLVLIRQYRPTVRRWLFELPAGTLEPGEDPRVAAARELTEETGYRALRLDPWFEFWAAPGITDERMRVFRATELEAGPTALEPGECAEVVLATPAQVEAAIDTGTIDDGKSLCVLERFAREKRSA